MRRLVALGSSAVSLDRNRGKGEPIDGARYIVGDVSREALEAVDFVPETIFHLAGGAAAAGSVANPLEDFLKTVLSTAILLDFLRINWPETHLVFVSSAAIYGQAADKRASRDDAYLPISPYGVHKRQAELLVLGYARIYQIKPAIVRGFSVYGPGCRKQLLWDAMEKASAGIFEFAGSGREMRDWVYVADFVESLLRISAYSGTDVPVMNAGTCHGTSVREVLTELFRIAGFDREPVFPGGDREGDPPSLVAGDSLEEMLGPLFVTRLADGLAAYVRWYKTVKHR